MLRNDPKNDRKYYWTMHSKGKIVRYGLSASKIKRIIRYPDRKEEGIAPGTIAVMKRKSKKNPQKGEVWVMYQKKSKVKNQKSKIGTENAGARFMDGQIKIISAWIYPGQSPKGKEIFVPDEVWDDLIHSNDLAEDNNEL